MSNKMLDEEKELLEDGTVYVDAPKIDQNSKMKCDYCERKAVGWVTYEGLHRVCEKHRQIIFELAGKGLIGLDFQRELEERGKNV